MARGMDGRHAHVANSGGEGHAPDGPPPVCCSVMTRTAACKFLIIGGGIGGLCVAIALRKAGFQAAVFEQAPELKEIGAGLTLWSNAIRALDKLGIGHAVRALRPELRHAALRDASGRVLMELPADAYDRAFGAPNVPLHRADLQSILLSALPADAVHLGARCDGFTEDPAGVTARFADGGTHRGDLLVGADGLRSVVRRQIFGPEPLRYAGYTAWRGVCRFPHDDPRLVAGETWGRGRRFGIVPLGGGRIYWFAAADAPEGESDGPAGAKSRLLSLFGDWHEPIRELLDATDNAGINRRDLYDRKPRLRWSSPGGRVTLLGDAAHPTTPNLGQGACQAIEDAVVLADCLAHSKGDVPDALRAYESRRAPHTARVVFTSRRIGRIAQWSNPLACKLRDALVARSSPEKQVRRLAWVVGHEV